MSIENERTIVKKLKADGLTLSEIAKKVDKSISWVNSRLKDEYLPKRRRTTTLERDDYSDKVITDPKLSSEIDLVKELRSQGLTYEKIANKLNRSIYWVHTRLKKKYSPRVTRNEKYFQEQKVVPFLIENGHSIVSQYVRIESGSIVQEADILSLHNNSICITEVKAAIEHHQLQTAIGQLIIHSFSYQNEKLRLQIALPFECQKSNFTDDLLKYFSVEFGINIIFIP